MNQKNSLNINICFGEQKNPIDLFKEWYEEAKKSEINDPNAVAVATSDNNSIPCLLYTSPSPRDRSLSRMPSSA